jgi:hypothetical protein
MGLVGLRKALRDGTAYDLGFMRGSPATTKRDLLVMGTNRSAPATRTVSDAVIVDAIWPLAAPQKGSAVAAK